MNSERSSRFTASGLPSGPRARSTTRQTSHNANDNRYSDRIPQQQQLRTQKSVANMSRNPRPRSPSRTRPSVDTPRPSMSSGRRPVQHRSGESTSSGASSVSSNASSLLDRLKAGTGYASSRTSLGDDDDAAPPPKPGAPSLRARRQAKQSQDINRDTTSYDGDGSTIWSKVAAAAGTLTVNVSKAWATNIPTMSGEETPEGGESRLTKALRAYHLDKARDPRDLPDWLFAPHERQVAPRNVRRYDEDENEAVSEPVRGPPRSKGLRDIYASAAASSIPAATSNYGRERGRYTDDKSGPPLSKASDRLRAIRDAKRGALVRDTAIGGNNQGENYAAELREERYDGAQKETQRTGLPSGPMRRRKGI